jgi:hypothetical protein
VTLTRHFKYLGAWVSDTLLWVNNWHQKGTSTDGITPLLLPRSACCANNQVQSLSCYTSQHHALGVWVICNDRCKSFITGTYDLYLVWICY